jgi:hypothetical protein
MGAVDRVLYEFVGQRAILSLEQVRQLVERHFSADQVESVIEYLVTLTFLGIEVGEDEFAFDDGTRDRAVITALSSRYMQSTGGAPRMKVHPAYHTYLELV